MDHLEGGWPPANLAVDPQARASLKTLLLSLAEMKKPEKQGTCTVTYANQQAASSSKLDFSKIDRDIDDCMITGAQRPDRHNARAVFVTARQMEQDILDRFKAKS